MIGVGAGAKAEINLRALMGKRGADPRLDAARAPARGEGGRRAAGGARGAAGLRLRRPQRAGRRDVPARRGRRGLRALPGRRQARQDRARDERRTSSSGPDRRPTRLTRTGDAPPAPARAVAPARPADGRAGRRPAAPAEGRPLRARERAALERADDHALGARDLRDGIAREAVVDRARRSARCAGTGGRLPEVYLALASRARRAGGRSGCKIRSPAAARTGARAGCRERRSAPRRRRRRSSRSTAAAARHAAQARHARSGARRSASARRARRRRRAASGSASGCRNLGGSPIYGPWAFGTAAYSTAVATGPAAASSGIHGTNQPELIPGRPSPVLGVRVPNGGSRRSARRDRPVRASPDADHVQVARLSTAGSPRTSRRARGTRVQNARLAASSSSASSMFGT